MKAIKFLLAFSFLAGSILFSSCGDDKPSEREQYEELRSTFKYKTYKTLSRGSVTIISTGYNTTVDSAGWKVEDTYFRLMLGYFWAVSGKPEFAFAEADVLTENAETENLKFLASMLNSCTMYEQGWTTLAKEESDKGMALISKGPDKELLETEVMIFHLMIGTVCVQQKNYEAAKFHFAGFAQLTGVDFPYKLIDIMVDVEKGDVQSGLKKAKILSQDPNVPESIRTELKTMIEEAEKQGGDVNSSLFWPKVVSSYIMDELKKSSQNGIGGLMGTVSSAVETMQ